MPLTTLQSQGAKIVYAPSGDCVIQDIDANFALCLLEDGTNPLTAAWDAGGYNIRALSLTPDGLSAGQVVYTGTNGILSAEAAFAYNTTTNTLTVANIAAALTGNVTGNCSGSSGTCTGLAGSATILATARTIGGTSFDGSANIVPGTITIADESSDDTCFVGFFTAATGSLQPKTGTNLTFASSTGILTATGFAGDITGNVTGNCSGTALTVTQAAQAAITSLGTLTTLTVDNININGSAITGISAAATTIDAYAGQAVTIEGVSFDGGVVSGMGTLGCGAITSTGAIKGTSFIMEGGANDTTIQPGTPSAAVTYTWPAADSTGAQYLTSNGSGALSWGTPAGAGDVVGPGSATDDAVARFDATSGKLLQDSVVTIANTTGNMAGVGTLGCGAITPTGDVATVGWTEYSATSTITGWANDPPATAALIYYKKVGNLVFVSFKLDDTSNATTVSFTLPYTSSNTVDTRTNLGYTYDNGASEANGVIVLPLNSATVGCYKENYAAWTTSGRKFIVGQFWYEAA